MRRSNRRLEPLDFQARKLFVEFGLLHFAFGDGGGGLGVLKRLRAADRNHVELALTFDFCRGGFINRCFKGDDSIVEARTFAAAIWASSTADSSWAITWPFFTLSARSTSTCASVPWVDIDNL